MSFKRSHISFLLLSGIGLFIILYSIATLLYPGGSEVDKLTKGFDWVNNYWCELMATHAENGEVNTARPVAITAMAVLCATLGLFWYNSSFLFKPASAGRHIIRYAGILSMISMTFLSTGKHDTVINISGTLGGITMMGTLTGLYKNKMKFLVVYGVVCLLLVAVNNYIYYTKNYFYALAVVQKITFLLFLLWFAIVTVRMYRKP